MDFMDSFQGRGQNRLLYGIIITVWSVKKGLLHLCKVSTQANLPRLIELFAISKIQYVKGLEVPYDSVDYYKDSIDLWIPRCDSFIRFKNYNLWFLFFECRNHYRRIIVMVGYMQSTEIVH